MTVSISEKIEIRNYQNNFTVNAITLPLTHAWTMIHSFIMSRAHSFPRKIDKFRGEFGKFRGEFGKFRGSPRQGR